MSQEDPETLRHKAELLRKEVESFELKKKNARDANEEAMRQEMDEKQSIRQRYSAVVPILKPDGLTVKERCDFTPRYKGGSSYITVCEASLPLGIYSARAKNFLEPP
jgi:hypothetical protein